MIKKIALGLIAVALAAPLADAQTASDNADNAAYSDGWNDDLNPPADNGGTGFGSWTNLNNGGGGKFIANAGTGGRQIEGANSFGIFAGNGSFAEGRNILSSLSAGTYAVLGRFDLDNTVGFSGFNLKSALGTALGDNELLSFGMTPATNNGIFVGGSINQTIDLGHDIRGNVINFSVAFNTNAGSYSITATDTSAGGSASVSGSLKSSGAAVAALGFGNFNTGNNQSLIFDSLSLQAVPEPSTLALIAGPAILGALMFVRRRRA